jgi:hypothetical protein
MPAHAPARETSTGPFLKLVALIAGKQLQALGYVQVLD